MHIEIESVRNLITYTCIVGNNQHQGLAALPMFQWKKSGKFKFICNLERLQRGIVFIWIVFLLGDKCPRRLGCKTRGRCPWRIGGRAKICRLLRPRKRPPGSRYSVPAWLSAGMGWLGWMDGWMASAAAAAAVVGGCDWRPQVHSRWSGAVTVRLLLKRLLDWWYRRTSSQQWNIIFHVFFRCEHVGKLSKKKEKKKKKKTMMDGRNKVTPHYL